jgi:DNA-directed RNA polymerase specialized sigma24 family protein
MAAISADGLARLLLRLHPDAEAGAREYERLRRTLLRFFDWRGAWPADECADEVLDRLAQRLEGGTAIDDVASYARGIARLVLLERRRQPSWGPLTAEAGFVSPAPQADTADVVRQDCLDACLAELPDESRRLALDYYTHKGHAKIANRQRLARALGLTESALRSRVQRLRDRLEVCVHACVAAREQVM